MSDLDALKERQGAGARWDAEAAPHDALLLARRGTAYFARVLSGLTDDDLDHGDRRAIIARVAYEARDMAEALAAQRAGRVPAPVDRARRQALGQCLPARALRHLFSHAEVHLNVEFRDHGNADWDDSAPMPDGPVPARDLPMIRARAVWRGALALGGGARAADLPAILREAQAAG